MDAHTPFHRTAVLLATALLTAAAASAATLSLSTNSVQFSSCSLTATVQVTAASATTFTVSQSATWFTVNADSYTTPATLTVTQNISSPLLAAATIDLKVGSAIDQTITVNPASGACTPGTGGLSIVPSPAENSNLVLSAVSGTVTGLLTLTNNTAGAVSYTVAAATNNTPNWLSIGTAGSTATNGTIGIGASASLTVIASTSGLFTGQYWGTLTVTPSSTVTTLSPTTVNVRFNVGTSGGGTSGSLTLNQTGNNTYPLSFSATTSGELPPVQFVSLQSSTGATTFTVTKIETSDGTAWLGAGNGGILVSAGYPVSYQLAGGLTVGLTAAASNLAGGTYTGTISLQTPSDGATAAVNVTLTVNGGATGVTVSPATSYQFTAPSGSSTTSHMVFTVTAQSGVTMGTPTRTSDAGWLSINTTGNSSYYQIDATANPSGLANGNYSGSITIPSTASDGTTGNTTISLTLIVGGGNGSTPTSSGILPSSLNFYYQPGTSFPNFGTTQLISVSGSQGTQFTAVADQPWIQIASNTATAPGTFSVSVKTDGLTAGNSYSGKITVTGTNGITKDIPVLLSISGSNTAIMQPQPTGDLVFTYQSGGSIPDTQSVAIYPSDGGAVPPLSVNTPTPWLSVIASSNIVMVSPINLSTLQAGSYEGSFTVTSGSYGNSPLTVPVVLVVNGGGTPGPLTLGTLNVFSAPVSGASQTQHLTVSASTATYFTSKASTQIGNWLTVSQTGNYTNQSLTVTATPTGLAAGTYYGTISLTAAGVTQTVPVTFQVGSGGTTGNVKVDKDKLTFSYVAGAQTPAAQAVSITNAAQGTASIPLGVTVSTSSGGNWLKTDFAAGSVTPYTLHISVNPANLAPGTYIGAVNIQPSGGDLTAVAVTLTVSATPTITVSPAALTFNYQAGGQTPTAQNVQVTGNVSNMAFTAQASTNDGGKWLSVTPTNGTAGPTATPISVKVSPGGLDAGTYTGTVTVNGTTSGTGGGTVTVTLNVTAPVPMISRVVNAATGAEGPIAPGELVSIYAPNGGANPVGPATPVQTTLDSTGKVSTSIGGVVVKFSGYPAPLTYAGAGQINAAVPYEVKNIANPTVQVTFMGQTSAAFALTTASTAPALFTANGSGTGPGAILNQDNSYNTPTNPAPRGSTVVLYMTGEGETSPAGVTGKVTTVASSAPLTPQPLLPIGVTIDGKPATVTFYGEAPGLISGVMQINVMVPADARTGEVPVAVSIGTAGNSRSTQSGVTVSVK